LAGRQADEMALIAVEFHTGVIDCVDFSCRLLRKAYRSGARVLLTAMPVLLGEIDRALWTFDERDFVPHLRLPANSAAIAGRTPIWLAERAGVDGVPALLVNVGAEAPAEPGVFERLIEIVGADPEQADRGRDRWRAYRAAGLAVTHHARGATRD
jgi:DNA polymerase III subunit chi